MKKKKAKQHYVQVIYIYCSVCNGLVTSYRKGVDEAPESDTHESTIDCIKSLAERLENLPTCSHHNDYP